MNLDSLASLPEALPRITYFLQQINTPNWHWFFRGAVAAGLLMLIAIYWRERKQ